MRALLDEVRSWPGIPTRSVAADLAAEPAIVLPMHVRRGDLELRLFSTVTTVGAPRDITVQEFRIECFIPAADASERAIDALRDA